MTIKTAALGLFLWTFLLTIKAHSEVLHWPQLCLSGKLVILNTSRAPVRAWLQKFSRDPRIETEVNLPAYSISSVAINSPNDFTRHSLLHFAPGKIQARFECGSLKSPAQSLEGGILTFKRSDLSENKLWIQNLFPGDNLVSLQFFDENSEMVLEQRLPLSSFEQKSFKDFMPLNSWSEVKINAANRFTAFNLTSTGASSPQKTQPQFSNVDSKAAYFVVGPRDGAGDSFVVRISDAALIVRARELVLHPEYEKIVFARIEKGHQGFNRNWSKSEKSFWSWSATEVTNFADLGSTACNGLPQQVEDDVDQWVKDPGRICFWSYRIKSELSPAQVMQP
jgi:hypothetical protein